MAVKVTRTFTATARGIGKPDYSRIVTAARERRGVYLGYGQTLKTFSLVFSVIPSPFAWVMAPLAPGATQRVIDCETGLPSPYRVPAGHTFTVIAAASAVTEDGLAWGYIGSSPLFVPYLILTMGMAPGGQTYFENKISGISTTLLDPNALLSHDMDVFLTNRGLGNLEGTIDYLAILSAVGTEPLPKVKMVRCKWCGHEHEVPNETTHVTCPECGQLFIVYDLSKFKETT